MDDQSDDRAGRPTTVASTIGFDERLAEITASLAGAFAVALADCGEDYTDEYMHSWFDELYERVMSRRVGAPSQARWRGPSR